MRRGNSSQRPVQLANGHLQPARLSIVAVGLLLPGPHRPAQLRPRIAQRLLRIHAIPAGVGRDARRVNRHTTQLHHAAPLRPLQNLREGVVQCPAVAATKRAQRPVVHSLPAPR